MKMHLKQLSFVISSMILLTACGGGSGSSGNTTTENNNNQNTQNPPITEEKTEENQSTAIQHNLVFPTGEFRIKAVHIGEPDFIYSIKENYKTLLNNSINESTKTLYQQNIKYDPTWGGHEEYLLTQNKVYYAENSQHPHYITSNTSGKIILTLDANTPDLLSTITFKNIALENTTLNSDYITTDLLNDFRNSNKNDQNWIKISQQIKNIPGTFPKNSVCHQYLTQQYNQPNISFGKFSSSQFHTFDEWIADQKELGYTPRLEIWAGYQVAYVPGSASQTDNFYHRLGYRSNAAVMKDGKLFNAYYDSGLIYDLVEEYDNSLQFKKGICNIYNQTAYNELQKALFNLQ